MTAERLRKLWKEHVVDYYSGPSECFDCYHRDCDWCGVLAEMKKGGLEASDSVTTDNIFTLVKSVLPTRP